MVRMGKMEHVGQGGGGSSVVREQCAVGYGRQGVTRGVALGSANSALWSCLPAVHCQYL